MFEALDGDTSGDSTELKLRVVTDLSKSAFVRPDYRLHKFFFDLPQPSWTNFFFQFRRFRIVLWRGDDSGASCSRRRQLKRVPVASTKKRSSRGKDVQSSSDSFLLTRNVIYVLRTFCNPIAIGPLSLTWNSKHDVKRTLLLSRAIQRSNQMDHIFEKKTHHESSYIFSSFNVGALEDYCIL